jgi:FkbM family methyltransferase
VAPLADLIPDPVRLALRARREHRRRVAFYRRFVGRDQLCFDVGANLGNRVELFLAIPARVVAVEPQSSCREILEARFGSNPGFTLVGAALGPEPGEAELMAADDDEASVLATLSREWVERVRESGRFSMFSWDRRERVEVTTLDAIIERYREPAFCKIDVEGYELEVLEGLTYPLRSLSFEFTPERPEATEGCVRRLVELGSYRFNYSRGESLVLEAERWMDAPSLLAAMARFRGDTVTFGDVYARRADL